MACSFGQCFRQIRQQISQLYSNHSCFRQLILAVPEYFNVKRLLFKRAGLLVYSSTSNSCKLGRSSAAAVRHAQLAAVSALAAGQCVLQASLLYLSLKHLLLQKLKLRSKSRLSCTMICSQWCFQHSVFSSVDTA